MHGIGNGRIYRCFDSLVGLYQPAQWADYDECTTGGKRRPSLLPGDQIPFGIVYRCDDISLPSERRLLNLGIACAIATSDDSIGKRASSDDVIDFATARTRLISIWIVQWRALWNGAVCCIDIFIIVVAQGIVCPFRDIALHMI